MPVSTKPKKNTAKMNEMTVPVPPYCPALSAMMAYFLFKELSHLGGTFSGLGKIHGSD
jgi:hypothetical protein